MAQSMDLSQESPAIHRFGGIGALHDRFQDLTERAIPSSLIALVARLGTASIFWLSGQTKVDGFLSVKASTYYLFEHDYRLPILTPEAAAWIATFAEHLFPILLVLGLMTRLSATALLVMTLVIQVFVLPEAWPTHLTWAAAFLYLMAKGGGRISLDHLLSRH